MDRVRFTHPLFASVVQAAATSDARRAAHRRLGAAVSGDEERAHHLALAATEPEREPRRPARGSGAPDVSPRRTRRGADCWRDRAALTPPIDVEARGRRAILEAEARLEAGDLAGSADVLEGARDWILPAANGRRRCCSSGRSTAYLDRSRATPTLRAWPLADAADDPTLAGRIHGRLALFEEDVEAGRAHGRAAVALIDPAINPSALAFVHVRPLLRRRAGRAATGPVEAFTSALALEPDVPSWEASTIPGAVVEVHG